MAAAVARVTPLQAIQATSFKLPAKNILLSIGSFSGKQEFLPAVQALAKLGFTLFGSLGSPADISPIASRGSVSAGTADFYETHGVPVIPFDFPHDADEACRCVALLRTHRMAPANEVS